MKTKEQYVLGYFKTEPDHLFWKAYSFQARIHANHARKDGMIYSVHQIEMSYFALLAGIDDPLTHALIQCHDVIEEARDNDGIEITQAEIAEAVDPVVALETVVLTKKKGLTLPEFIEHLEKIVETGIRPVYVKTLDRYSNIRRSMFGVLEVPRIRKYMAETYQILAIAEQAIYMIESGCTNNKPQENIFLYAKGLRSLRGSMKAVMRGIEFALRHEKYEKEYTRLYKEHEDLKREMEALKRK
ncbi:MAG: hypothetical protein NT136_00115 [Candidatus Moranbacteria bacterium]|nr:hypothetical protein [Candidatus Moranbacteria bacterium]